MILSFDLTNLKFHLKEDNIFYSAHFKLNWLFNTKLYQILPFDWFVNVSIALQFTIINYKIKWNFCK
jgi:hypothetical protein